MRRSWCSKLAETDLPQGLLFGFTPRLEIFDYKFPLVKYEKL